MFDATRSRPFHPRRPSGAAGARGTSGRTLGRTVRRAVLAGALGALAVPTWAAAQGVQYTQRSRTEMGGPMGAMMSAMGQGGDSDSHITILGARMRTDSDDQSTIVDMDAGTLVMLNHDDRTFVRTTFEELAAEAARMRAQMEEQMGREIDAGSATPPEVEIIPMDDRETIEGYETRRTVMTVRMSTVLPFNMQGMEGMGGGDGSEMTGVMVNDLWLASDVPGMEMTAEMAREWAEKVSGALSGMLPGGGGAMAGVAADGQMAGIPMRATSSTVMVPEGTEFDLQAVLDGADEPLGGGGGGLGAMARAMMGGRGGGGDAGGQMVFMRVVTEVTDLQEGGIDASVFEVPGDYRETTLAETFRRD